MDTNIIAESITNPVAAREYSIKGTRYIVTATVRDGASQDAAAINHCRSTISNKVI